MHVYPGTGSSSDLSDSIERWKTAASGKPLFVEELGFQWRGTDRDIVTDFKTATDSLNGKGIPWLVWSIIPDPVSDCQRSYDEDGDNGPIPLTQAKVDFKSAMDAAANAEQFQDWGI